MDSAAASPERQFFEHLSQGRLMFQRSRSGGGLFFYPRLAQPLTGDTDLEWVESSGLGAVYASTLIRQRRPAPDYNVVLVDLDDGPRMMSRVEGMESVPIGLRVRARLIHGAEGPVLVFEPADGGRMQP